MSSVEENQNGNEPNNLLEESSLTMVDVLEQEEEMEEEYAAVLGASDEKCCTYNKGAVKRQALYSCLTCCPEARNDMSKSSGVCLACSYRCHENHELVELYTKRDFRCDCPTERLSNNRCLLNPVGSQPQPANAGNKYNQNFQGLYCKCKRPYPDPERTQEEVMLQCAVCEDWYHLPHLKNGLDYVNVLEECTEMICDICMDEHEFLYDYMGYALIPVKPEEVKEKVDILTSPLEEKGKTLTDDSKSKENENDEDFPEPCNKKAKLSEESKEHRNQSKDCKRPPKSCYSGAAFWGSNLRTALCQCKTCLKMYKDQGVEFLLDVDDSSKSYEEAGKKKTQSSYEQGIRALATMGRVQQIDAITEYNKMKEKLKDFLHTFAVNKTVVTEDDIKRFFDELKNNQDANIGQPHFCR